MEWTIWVVGVVDWADVVYRFNGGRAVFESGVGNVLRTLPSGCHEVEVAEDGVSTHWSVPYAFCMAGSAAGRSAPVAPTGLRLTKVDIALAPDNLELTWNAVSGATYYNVYHHAAGEYFDFEATVTTNYYLDRYPNLLYYDSYIVVACNDAGCSPESDFVTEQ